MFEDKPIGIIILWLLVIINGIATMILGFYYIFFIFPGLFLIGLAAFILTAAKGVLDQELWAWKAIMVLGAVSLIMYILLFSPIGIAINTALLISLLRFKKHFQAKEEPKFYFTEKGKVIPEKEWTEYTKES